MSTSSSSSNELKQCGSGHSLDPTAPAKSNSCVSAGRSQKRKRPAGKRASLTQKKAAKIASEIVEQFQQSASQVGDEERALLELIRGQCLMLSQMMKVQMEMDNHDRMMRLAQQLPEAEKHRYIEKLLNKFLEKDDSDDDEIDVNDSSG